MGRGVGRHFAGEHYTVSDAQIIPHPVWPELYFGGSSEATLAAARTYAGAIAPGAAERDRAGAAPREELGAFDATGLLAIAQL